MEFTITACTLARPDTGEVLLDRFQGALVEQAELLGPVASYDHDSGSLCATFQVEAPADRMDEAVEVALAGFQGALEAIRYAFPLDALTVRMGGPE